MLRREPHLFISYSRVDKSFTVQLERYLRQAYDNVWFDESLHGGQLWWDEILKHISQCDIFIYLLSPESLESTYCLAEFSEAVRLQKQILPVLIRDRAPIPPDISKYQYVDMSGGFKARSINNLQASLARLTRELPSEPLPAIQPHPIPPPLIADRPLTVIQRTPILIARIVVLILVFVITVLALINSKNNSATASLPTLTSTLQSKTPSPTDVPFLVSSTPVPTNTSLPTVTLTNTPVPPTNTPLPTTTFTNMPLPTMTNIPTSSGPLSVKKVDVVVTPKYSNKCEAIIVDNAQGYGDKFVFSAAITSTGNGTLTYRWDRSDSSIAPTQTIEITSSPTTINTYWVLSAGGTFWERLVILTPIKLTSDQVEFSRTNCP